MSQVAAIQTYYKGYHFRSRLEARWAVFFDSMGIEYQYEPEGFEKILDWDDDKSKHEIVRYLPDFYLPESGTWVEVKGGIVSSDDAKKMAKMLDFGSPLPFFTDSSSNQSYSSEKFKAGIVYPCHGLLMLGDVPEGKHGLVLHPLIVHGKGLQIEHIMFSPGTRSPKLIDRGAASMLSFFGVNLRSDWIDGYGCSDHDAQKFFDAKSVFVSAPMAYQKVCEAYAAARSARFEHGQYGA